MLRHLKVCEDFSEGHFKCPICKEREEYPTGSCRKGRRDRVTLKQRLGNGVESLCNSLRRSSRSSGSQSGPSHCECCHCSRPSETRPSSASSDETLPVQPVPVLTKSAKVDSAMSIHAYDGFMRSKTLENADINGSTLYLPQHYRSELGDTGFVEMDGTNPIGEMEGTMPILELEDPTRTLVPVHTGSSAYRPIDFSSELRDNFLPTKLSSPSTSQSERSPTSVSPASSGNGTSQIHTSLGTDASSHEYQLGFQKLHELVAQDPLRQSEARFNKPDNVSDRYPFQYKHFDQSATRNSVFKHTSVHEELSSPPVNSCYPLHWVSSNPVSEPQSQDAVYPAPEVLSPFNPSITTALDMPQQRINIDTAPFGGSPSSMGGLAPIYDTSPSSKSNTSFADSDLLSPDQADDETAVLKCDQCEFVPTGSKKKNFKAYLRKHRRIHDERRVTCVQCNKEFTRQDNLTAHKQRVHQRKRHHESETDFGEQIPQRKKSRSSRRGGSESPSGYMF